MNYIQQAYNGLHDLWRYVLGIVIIFFAWQLIGMVPLGVILAAKVLGDPSVSMPTDIPQMNSILGSNLFLFLMLLAFAFGLLGVFLTSKFLHKQSITSLTTTRKKIDWKRFWFIFILWGVVSSSFVLVDYYMSPDDYEFNFNLQPFMILAAIAIFLIPLQTSFEEYFFRGYLMQGFGILFKNKWLPLLITSAAFGLMHIANPEVDKFGPVIMVYYIGTGLFLGIITLMDDGLELALGFHAANNLFTALLVTADWTAFQTHSILKDLSDPSEMALAEIFVPVFVVFPIILFILSKKYNWTNWKDKLFGNVIEPPKEDYKILD
ncbi:CPBP family intramembrane glutamic endopeptidase [uncultured Algibacter sp.]|uniref:CPBP family intramembrane glutamic endopeptidase n=1 Tax=uncultured Algibacter sp. TaxID=298659 RepID=UPI00260835C1|nr:CPBP family intramembrane glutamic endopeptidase [uncultured Algibacter sp.]